jgi:hypothetical protein
MPINQSTSRQLKIDLTKKGADVLAIELTVNAGFKMQ